MRPHALLLALAAVAACADNTSSSTPAAVTVVQLSAGDANCPTGGASFTAGGTTAYACNGAQGGQGTQGTQGIQGIPGAPALYQSRADGYCDTVVSDVDNASLFLIASCRAARDLPLSGSCEQSTFSDAVLFTNQPSGFFTAEPVPTIAAQWVCGWWRAGSQAPVKDLPSARATICCVAVP
jgi:hypothetical protein